MKSVLMSPIPLKDKFMRSLRIVVLAGTFAITALSSSAIAQIQTDILRPADTYDAGVLDAGQGGLDASLWLNTSAQRATYLLENMPTIASGAGHSFARAALLSGGVPPHGQDDMERNLYMAARLGAILDLGDMAAFDKIAQRANLNPNNSSYVSLFAQKALLSGNTQTACAIADTVTIGRKEPKWAKLRAYCHIVRDELSAAELTADLLRRGKHKDKTFFTLLGALTGSTAKLTKDLKIKTPLHISMAAAILKEGDIGQAPLPPSLALHIALDERKTPKQRFAALRRSAHIVSPEHIKQILSGLADTPLENLDALKLTKKWSPEMWGQTYSALKVSTDMEANAKLVVALLSEARSIGLFAPISAALAQDISILPYHFQANNNPYVFAKIAVNNRDLGALRGLYQDLHADNPLRNRIALASDAIGNGFILGDLGVDIDSRLSVKGSKNSRAVRDAYIAAALGAHLSGNAITVLGKSKNLKGKAAHPAHLLMLSDAARRGAKAETALHVARILGNRPVSALRADSLATVLSALTAAQMPDMAGALAAQDFLGAPQ